MLADAAGRSGHLAEAQEHIRAMYQLVERTGDRRMAEHVQSLESATAHCSGHWELARRRTDLLLHRARGARARGVG